MRTLCPLGGSAGADEELYPASCDPKGLTPETFRARRAADRIHYRMVRNRETGTVRADPILDEDATAALYANSTRADPDLARDAAATYARYGPRVLPLLPDRRGLLDVGSGEGHFLAAAVAWGFDRLAGVEPALEASRNAPTGAPYTLIPQPLGTGIVEPDSFSLITGFQVLDHLARPLEALEVCLEALIPGGIMFWICHDIGHPLARLLGRRCPMIDVQHLVLYDRRTLRALFERAGFEVLEVFGVANRYPLDYWLTLSPLPERARRVLRHAARRCRLSGLRITANLGNIGIIARRPQ